MSMVTEKRCKLCGKDVSQVKRTKDAAGNYYCESCVPAARSPRQAANVAPAGRAPATSAKACANCGTAIGALQEVWEWKDRPVCWTCRETLKMDDEQRARERQTAATNEADKAVANAAARQRAAQTEVISTGTRRKTLLTSVGLVLFGLICLGIAPFGEDRIAKVVLGVGGPAMLLAAAVGFNSYRKACGTSLAAGLQRDMLPALGGWVTGAIGWSVVALLGLLMLASPFMLAPLGYRLGGEGTTAGYALGSIGGAIGLTAAGITLALAKSIDRRKCPKCHSFTQTVVEASDHLGQDVRVVKGTTNVQVRDGINAYGTVIANVQVPTERTVVTELFAVYRRCNKCGHRWTTRQ